MRSTSSWRWFAVWAVLLGLLPAARADVTPAPTIPVMERPRQADLPLYSPDRVIVKFDDATARSVVAREAVVAQAGGTIARRYTTLPDVASVALAPEVSVEAAIAALQSDPRVAYAEPDYIYTSFIVPNDPGFAHQWGLHNIGQEIADYPTEGAGIDVDGPEAWEYGTGTGEVVVAVTDTGCDFGHPDLAANMWINPGETPANNRDDDGNGFVDDVHGWDFANDNATTFDGGNDPSNSYDFHGTHTSGTVGAIGNNGIGVAGVCWNVRIMSLKFLENGGSTEDAIACIDYVVQMKQRGVNVRAINASWGGGGYSTGLLQAIEAAGDAGILFVAASGNGGGDNVADNNDLYPVYPSNYETDTLISVGAWTRYNLSANFSNYGPTSVDLLAPGGLVASTGPNGTYYYSSGTSMAAPHVSGAVALLASLDPDLTAAEIKAVLLETTAAVPLAKPTLTGGRLDLRAAAERVAGDVDPPPPPPPPPPPAPIIFSAKLTKKQNLFIVDGRLFTPASVIEVDGVVLPIMRYSPRDQLPEGEYIRISGKAPGQTNQFFPRNRAVVVTVYDSSTGQRSAPFSFTRTR